MRPTTLIAAVAILTAAAPALAADALILRQRIEVPSSPDKTREQTQYYTASLRVSDDERTRSIADLDKKTVTSIDKRKQTYRVTSFKELAARQDTHDARVKDLPEPVRDMVKADQKVVVRATGKTATIAGYETEEFAVESPGVAGHVWIAKALDLGPRRAEWVRLAELYGARNSPGGQLEDALAQLPGVPLRRSLSMTPLPLVVSEVLEVRRGPIPPDLLRIPAGFSKAAPRAQPKPAAGTK